MTRKKNDHEEDFDISLPFSIWMILILSSEMEKAKTDAEKLTLLRRCFVAYLVMNAGHFLFEGVKTLTDFILMDFTPFTEDGKPASPDVASLRRYPLSDSVWADVYRVDDAHFDLFIDDKKDIWALRKQLEEQGLIEADEDEKEICNE